MNNISVKNIFPRGDGEFRKSRKKPVFDSYSGGFGEGLLRIRKLKATLLNVPRAKFIGVFLVFLFCP